MSLQWCSNGPFTFVVDSLATLASQAGQGEDFNRWVHYCVVLRSYTVHLARGDGYGATLYRNGLMQNTLVNPIANFEFSPDSGAIEVRGGMKHAEWTLEALVTCRRML
jgi:hypothetical protein